MNGEPSLEPLSRVIGRYHVKTPGPLVICVGGMHGNEPAGVYACRRVLATLEAMRPPFKGEWLALAGNIPALGENRRFIDEDLNRIWLTERIQQRAAGLGGPDTVETRQQDALLSEVETALARNPTATYFIDLHTTSAPGAPFSVFGDTLHNRHLARRLPGSMVLGLEEHLDGTMLNYVNFLGHVGVGFEAGQHGSEEAVDIHELAIWKTLTLAGALDYRRVPDAVAAEGRVRALEGPHPQAVEIRYRHGVGASDGFVMEPDFENMMPVAKGALMARDRNGEIRAALAGRVLMPLYQSQGSDGFFIVRDIRPFWLQLSALMRRSGLQHLLVRLPGVRPHPDLEDTVKVRWPLPRRWTVDLFHLFGYRKRGEEGPYLVMRWRRERPRD